MKRINQASYVLHLADNALILGHRNSEWTGHGPILEQDIAISNIALDLIGQARNFYQYAANLINEHEYSGATENTLAYLRDAWDFKNCLLAEQPNGDWAKTILRQFLLSTYQYYLYEQLQYSRDSTIAAISEKAFKEITYHLRWSSEWVIRLGDGTDESHQRMLKATADLWKFTGELFIPAAYELQAVQEGTGVDVSLLKPIWKNKVNEVFEEATLPLPAANETAAEVKGGKEGKHTEHLGYILAEMQFLQRAYPNAEW
jgi:ring-1,2-phenylacetyl-CoA epoxidase subunit PaaC